MAKMTARIDDDIYNIVMQKLHYGQQTALFRAIFDGLANLIQTEGLSPVAQFIAKTSSITLDPVFKEKKL